MRPVNLIPDGQRRGGTGVAGGRNIAGYAFIGALVVVLIAVSAIALFNKKVSDRQVQADSLRAQVDSAEAQAASFSSFTNFQQIHDARVETIDSLAKSRFDWQRVMRELSIVLPQRVYLISLTGTVSPTVSVNNGSGLSLRGSIPGPALELTGCAKNQRTVARMIAAMHDIDGVGRVLVSKSTKGDPPSKDEGSAADSADAKPGCAARPTYPTFELVAAFDGVPTTATDPAATDTATPTAATDTPTAAPTTATTPEAGTTTTTPTDGTATPATTTSSTDGGVAGTSDQAADQQTAIAAAQQSADKASQIPAGGGN